MNKKMLSKGCVYILTPKDHKKVMTMKNLCYWTSTSMNKLSFTCKNKYNSSPKID